MALLLCRPGSCSADARANYERLASAGARGARSTPAELPDALEGAALIVDAMLGTGFEGAPRAPLDAAIEAINAAPGSRWSPSTCPRE